jgi:hypothetical protein
MEMDPPSLRKVLSERILDLKDGGVNGQGGAERGQAGMALS